MIMIPHIEKFGLSWPLFVAALVVLMHGALFANAFSVTSGNRRPLLQTTTSSTQLHAESNKDKAASNDKAAIIFLHGLGDSPDGWSKLGEWLPNYAPNLAKLDITYVFPPAHNVAITVNGGEKMPGWFDVFDWPIGIDARDDARGLAMSVKRIEEIVNELKEEEGIDPSRVILGGFSQGGAVALTAAYNRRRKGAIPYAGCVVMSGWLPLKEYLDVSEEIAKATPLFWAHGQLDDKILYEQQVFGVDKLDSLGVDVTAHSYPVGHESTSTWEEIEDMANFIESVLCKTEDDEDEQYDYESMVITPEDAEKNALLYYLCSLPIDESSGVGVKNAAYSNTL
jgi:predicted esterase